MNSSTIILIYHLIINMNVNFSGVFHLDRAERNKHEDYYQRRSGHRKSRNGRGLYIPRRNTYRLES